MTISGGHEKNYQDFMNEIKNTDLKAAADILDLEYSESGSILIPFLGRTYHVSHKGIFRDDDMPVDVIRGSLLAGYVLQQGTGDAANEFVPPNKLTKTVLATGHSYFGSLESRLAELVDDGPERFTQIIISLGGCIAGEVGSGGTSWIVDLLPKMPMQIVFYEGDEDFPPEIRFLFDLNAINFLEFEHIAFLTSVFVDELEKLFAESRK